MLDTALDYGITEKSFWDMTFIEVQRAVKSAAKVKKLEAQERAYYDYTLANLIARGVSKVLGGKEEYPAIEEAYSGLFDDVMEERKAKIEEQKMNLSAIRFRQFAQSHNDRFNKEVVSKNE